MSAPASPKQVLRTLVRQRVAALDRRYRQEAGESLCRHLLALPALAHARGILIYLPLASEIDILPAARAWLAAGEVVAVPRVLVGGSTMEAVAVDALPGPPEVEEKAEPRADEPAQAAAARFARDALGVRTPLGGRALERTEIDAVIVPGLAFDAAGGRLGRGGGFYDRWLAGRGAGCLVVGVCFEAQIVERVPMEPHDASVDMVLTERGVVYTRGVERPSAPSIADAASRATTDGGPAGEG